MAHYKMVAGPAAASYGATNLPRLSEWFAAPEWRGFFCPW